MDFSFDMLNRYQAQAAAAPDPGPEFNGMFRDELLNKEEVMHDFFRRIKAQPGYSHLSFSSSTLRYMTEVLKLNIQITENSRSQ